MTKTSEIEFWKKTEEITIRIRVTDPDIHKMDEEQIADLAFTTDLDADLENEIAIFCENDELHVQTIGRIAHDKAIVTVRGTRLVERRWPDRESPTPA